MVEAVMGMSPNSQWGIINTIWARGGGRRAPHSESAGKTSLIAPKHEKYEYLLDKLMRHDQFIFFITSSIAPTLTHAWMEIHGMAWCLICLHLYIKTEYVGLF